MTPVHFYLIRGLAREAAHWGRLPALLQEQFPRSLVTTLDLPGAGVHFQRRSPLSVRGMVRLMREEFLQERREGEVSVVVSVSLGAMVAVKWMQAHPQDFSQAVLINTSFAGISPIYHRLRPSAVGALLKVIFLKGREKEAQILRLVGNHPEVFEETLEQWVKIQQERPMSLANLLRQLISAATTRLGDYRPVASVLLLASTHDRMVNVECSRSLAEHWSAALDEHPSAGHDLSSDDPEWIARKIKERLNLGT